jgi:hypothetical protein
MRPTSLPQLLRVQRPPSVYRVAAVLAKLRKAGERLLHGKLHVVAGMPSCYATASSLIIVRF